MNIFKHFEIDSFHNLIRIVGCFVIIYLGIIIFKNVYASGLSEWPMGELLINYRGGFVRRGFYGQLLLFFGGKEVVWLATTLQKIIIMIFVLCVAYLVFKWKSVSLTVIFTLGVVFSPGALLDMAGGGGFEYLDRKEIIFYIGLMAIYFLLSNQPYISVNRLLLIAAICSILVLTHEIFYIVFCPILFFLLLQNRGETGRVTQSKIISLFIIPVSIVFILTVLFPGNIKVVEGIRSSLAGSDAKNIGGGLWAITWKLKDTLNLVSSMYIDGSIVYWVFHCIIGLGFNAIFCMLLLKRAQKDRIYYFALYWILTAIIVCACLGWDWGRWISIASIGTPLVYAVIYAYQPADLSSERKDTLALGQHLILVPFISLLCMWSLYTRPPHCCAQGLDRIIFSEQNFKRVFPF
jgi:hypothetical protein